MSHHATQEAKLSFALDNNGIVVYTYLGTLIISQAIYLRMASSPTFTELILALRRKIMERSHGTLRGELSSSQFEVLWYVAAAGSTPMEAIALHLGVKPPSVTALIAALERKGLVNRTRDLHDRRIVSVVLTPAAKRRLASIKKRKEQIFESLFSKLSASDRKELIRLLTLLTEE